MKEGSSRLRDGRGRKRRKGRAESCDSSRNLDTYSCGIKWNCQLPSFACLTRLSTLLPRPTLSPRYPTLSLAAHPTTTLFLRPILARTQLPTRLRPTTSRLRHLSAPSLVRTHFNATLKMATPQQQKFDLPELPVVEGTQPDRMVMESFKCGRLISCRGSLRSDSWAEPPSPFPLPYAGSPSPPRSHPSLARPLPRSSLVWMCPVSPLCFLAICRSSAT